MKEKVIQRQINKRENGRDRLYKIQIVDKMPIKFDSGQNAYRIIVHGGKLHTDVL